MDHSIESSIENTAFEIAAQIKILKSRNEDLERRLNDKYNRDALARDIMLAIICAVFHKEPDHDLDFLARGCFNMADAMIRASKVPPVEPSPADVQT